MFLVPTGAFAGGRVLRTARQFLRPLAQILSRSAHDAKLDRTREILAGVREFPEVLLPPPLVPGGRIEVGENRESAVARRRDEPPPQPSPGVPGEGERADIAMNYTVLEIRAPVSCRHGGSVEFSRSGNCSRQLRFLRLIFEPIESAPVFSLRSRARRWRTFRSSRRRNPPRLPSRDTALSCRPRCDPSGPIASWSARTLYQSRSIEMR